MHSQIILHVCVQVALLGVLACERAVALHGHLHGYSMQHGLASERGLTCSCVEISSMILASRPKSNSSLICLVSSTTAEVRSNFISVLCRNCAAALTLPRSKAIVGYASGYCTLTATMPFLGPCFDLRASVAAMAALETVDDAAVEAGGSLKMLPGISLATSTPADSGQGSASTKLKTS